MTTVLVLNGPNLNRLGTREPEKYGSETLADLRAQLEAQAPDGTNIDLRQSNSEAELVGWLHDAVDARTPVILNPAAFTHYSVALRDAAAQVSSAGIELIEVHLTNPHTREDFRQVSYISGVATGIIAGFGFGSYRLALEQIVGS